MRRSIAAAMLILTSGLGLAELMPQAKAQDAAAFLAGTAKDCPGCNLAGASLKRRNFTGANLAGANLAGASFHRSVLRGADLSGADLTGANLLGLSAGLDWAELAHRGQLCQAVPRRAATAAELGRLARGIERLALQSDGGGHLHFSGLS